MKKMKLAEKSRLVRLPAIDDVDSTIGEKATAPPPQTPPPIGSNAPGNAPGRVFTGAGAMLGSLGSTSPLGKELVEIKQRLKEFEGSLPVKLLDPKEIARSRWANRHPDEFNTAEFAELKAEIASAGTNTQPIKVRPTTNSSHAYELVFGHRRLQACLELGLPVLALIADISEAELWIEMERENRQRKDLSPWEQGKSLQRAIQGGLFPSIRALCAKAGIDQSNASKLLKLAELPPSIVEAFPSPTLIQQAWAGPLAELVQRDPDTAIERARTIKGSGQSKSPKEVYALLMGHPGAGKQNITITGEGGKVLATLVPKPGRLTIEIRANLDLAKVEAAVRQLVTATK